MHRRAIAPPELLCDDACAVEDRLLCGVTAGAAALDDRRPSPAASISEMRTGSVVSEIRSSFRLEVRDCSDTVRKNNKL